VAGGPIGIVETGRTVVGIVAIAEIAADARIATTARVKPRAKFVVLNFRGSRRRETPDGRVNSCMRRLERQRSGRRFFSGNDAVNSLLCSPGTQGQKKSPSP